MDVSMSSAVEECQEREITPVVAPVKLSKGQKRRRNKKLQKERLRASLETHAKREDTGNPENREEVPLNNTGLTTESSIQDSSIRGQDTTTTSDGDRAVSKKRKRKKSKKKRPTLSDISNIHLDMGISDSTCPEREEYRNKANGETESSTTIASDVKSTVLKSEGYMDVVNDERDSSGREMIVDAKALTKASKHTANANDDMDVVNDERDSSGRERIDAKALTKASKHTANANDDRNRTSVDTSRKKLLILDVNGLLADIILPPPKDRKSDKNILRRAVFKRPFLDDFLRFCFERFDVGIWSSRTKKILDHVVDYLLGDLRKKLLFLWDVSQCTISMAKTLENKHKCIVFKELRKIWDNSDPNLAWEKGYYNESNTLLLDDSPYKALLNPKHTGIFPISYSYKDTNDSCLGPDGDLRVYLEGVAATENVQMYVKQHPFGEHAIDETSPHWAFYSGVLKQVNQPMPSDD